MQLRGLLAKQQAEDQEERAQKVAGMDHHCNHE